MGKSKTDSDCVTVFSTLSTFSVSGTSLLLCALSMLCSVEGDLEQDTRRGYFLCGWSCFVAVKLEVPSFYSLPLSSLNPQQSLRRRPNNECNTRPLLHCKLGQAYRSSSFLLDCCCVWPVLFFLLLLLLLSFSERARYSQSHPSTVDLLSVFAFVTVYITSFC